MDITRDGGYDLDKLLKFDLVPTSYLFSEDQLTAQPIKRILVQELEKEELSASDCVSHTNWELSQSAFLVEVMANFRKIDIERLNTFGEMCGNLVDYLSIDIRSTRIDFVFDMQVHLHL